MIPNLVNRLNVFSHRCSAGFVLKFEHFQQILFLADVILFFPSCTPTFFAKYLIQVFRSRFYLKQAYVIFVRENVAAMLFLFILVKFIMIVLDYVTVGELKMDFSFISSF